MNTSYSRTPSKSSSSESERLSADLAIFLSNPALSSKLTDGSLDLASYSSTINSELAVLERECIALHRQAEPDVRILREEMGVCDEILAGLQEMLLVSLCWLSSLLCNIICLSVFPVVAARSCCCCFCHCLLSLHCCPVITHKLTCISFSLSFSPGISSRPLRSKRGHPSTPRPISLPRHTSSQPPSSRGRPASLPRTYRRPARPGRNYFPR
jgi:hypothetical protein